ncbi:hypothetical protein [Caminibacter pacificus]|jgi:HPt (histidine-containing phosphotransfer) domain-containing protein
MILVMQNNQIVGIDKSLLNFLEIDLHNLSEAINKIELEISALQNKSFTINNKSLKVSKIDLISLQDISLYQMTPDTVNNINETPSINLNALDELQTIKPLEIETPQINIEELVPISEDKKHEDISIIEELDNNQEISPKINFEDELFNIKPEIEPTKENFNEISKPQNLSLESESIPSEPSEIALPKEETQQPISISISFEDELSEVQEILNLPEEEAKTLINQEVKQAAQELGIDETMTKELLVDLYKQIENEKHNFQKALNNKDYESLHKISHKLKGAALNLRLSKLAYILKVIDEKSKQKASIDTLKELVNKFYEFVDKINDKKVNISPEIRNIIMKTVQEYLETQNEKKFKKDKKYIEKLLNKRIDSVEDLKNILKG